MTYRRIAVACTAAMALQTAAIWAHCEIPCGIYGDELRFSMIEENIRTVEKSMKMIVELSGDSANANQVARWVNNKESHADNIREIVTQYFLTQRIKLPSPEVEAQEAYRNKLALLHQMLVYAMKCKQTTDTANADRLRELAQEFKQAYSAG